MPIPRLQVSGTGEDRFLYEYGWDQGIKQGLVGAYQRGASDAFDNRLSLCQGVGEALLRLNGILRPVLRREWSVKVASMNDLPESRLEEFLFGASRIPLGEVRGPLSELQRGRCFYCEGALRGPTEVDHFIPWARYSDNGLDNLVVAHARCNNRKRDFLAAAKHVERWSARNTVQAADIAQAAADFMWERDAARSRSVAVATYSRLDEGAKVWIEGATLVGLEKVRVERALAGWR
ncbi:MAG TPA: HNH endonuclease [Anaeromyxobacteraceae bacterium]|nr:HNH endonuclease [Anaeromyxobacteraceae bacterium]